MTRPSTLKTPFARALHDAGLTAKKFAELTETPPNTVYNWCRLGKNGRNAPRWAKRELDKIAERTRLEPATASVTG